MVIARASSQLSSDHRLRPEERPFPLLVRASQVCGHPKDFAFHPPYGCRRPLERGRVRVGLCYWPSRGRTWPSRWRPRWSHPFWEDRDGRTPFVKIGHPIGSQPGCRARLRPIRPASGRTARPTNRRSDPALATDPAGTDSDSSDGGLCPMGAGTTAAADPTVDPSPRPASSVRGPGRCNAGCGAVSSGDGPHDIVGHRLAAWQAHPPCV
jgi:hypothetical protein